MIWRDLHKLPEEQSMQISLLIQLSKTLKKFSYVSDLFTAGYLYDKDIKSGLSAMNSLLKLHLTVQGTAHNKLLRLADDFTVKLLQAQNQLEELHLTICSFSDEDSSYFYATVIHF